MKLDTYRWFCLLNGQGQDQQFKLSLLLIANKQPYIG
jgi:hypothetical protein